MKDCTADDLTICATPIDAAFSRPAPLLDLNRRHFMRLAILGSTALLFPCGLLEALESSAAPQSAAAAVPGFAALLPLSPGAVRADGWLAGWLGKQVDGLGYHLADVSWPFSSAYWQGQELNGQSEEWWPWEQKAYWIDGARRLALVTGDEHLLRRVHEPIDFTLAHQRPEGYLGPEVIRNPDGNFHRWPHTLFFRGLAADADAGDPHHRSAHC